VPHVPVAFTPAPAGAPAAFDVSNHKNGWLPLTRYPGVDVASLLLIAGVAPSGIHPGHVGRAAASLALFEFRISSFEFRLSLFHSLFEYSSVIY